MTEPHDLHCRYLYRNRFTAGPNYVITAHSHLFWHAEFVKTGELETTVGGTVFVQHAGDTILLPPGISHGFVYRAPGTTVFSVKFEVVQSQPAAKPIELKGHEAVGHIFAALDSLLLYQSRPSCVRRHAVDCLLAGLLHLFMKPFKTQIAAAPTAVVTGVKKVVERSEGRSLTVAEIAREMGFSESHVRTEFRTKENISLKKYIDRQRSAVAAHYLAYSDMPIKEIVGIMEFPDPQCFSRFCRRLLGHSPRQIRGSIAKGSNI